MYSSVFFFFDNCLYKGIENPRFTKTQCTYLTCPNSDSKVTPKVGSSHVTWVVNQKIGSEKRVGRGKLRGFK